MKEVIVTGLFSIMVAVIGYFATTNSKDNEHNSIEQKNNLEKSSNNSIYNSSGDMKIIINSSRSRIDDNKENHIESNEAKNNYLNHLLDEINNEKSKVKNCPYYELDGEILYETKICREGQEILKEKIKQLEKSYKEQLSK